MKSAMLMLIAVLCGLGHADEAYQTTNAVGYWAGLDERIIHVKPGLSVSECRPAHDAHRGELFLICTDRVYDVEDPPRYVYSPKKDRVDLLSGDETTCSNLITGFAGLAFYYRVLDTDKDQMKYRHIRDNATLRRWTPPAGVRVLSPGQITVATPFSRSTQ